MTTSTIYLEIKVEVDHDADIVNTVRIINRTDFPSAISVDITDFLSIEEITQVGQSALEAMKFEEDKLATILEDRNKDEAYLD